MGGGVGWGSGYPQLLWSQAPLGGTWQLYVYHSLSLMTMLVVRDGSSGFAEMGCGLTSEEMEAESGGTPGSAQREAAHTEESPWVHGVTLFSDSHDVAAPPPLSGQALAGDGTGGSWEPLPSQLGFQLTLLGPA